MRIKELTLLCALFILLGGVALGDDPFQDDEPCLPMKVTGSFILTDTGDDKVYRLTDFNLDGDFNDPGEIILFFDPADQGQSSNPISITTGPKGYIYVSDTTQDIIFRLMDENGDGDALDPGESKVWFDNTNASNVTTSSIFGMSFTKDGDCYAVNSGTSTVPDMILFFSDLSNNGDCMDMDECVVLYDSVEAANKGLPAILKVPMPCALGNDGYLYVSDVNDPFGADPILRMKDEGGDKTLYEVNDITYYYDDTIGDYDFRNVDSLAFNHDEKLIMNESLDDTIYISNDANGNNHIDEPGECLIYMDPTFHGYPQASKGTAVAGKNDLHWDIYLPDYGATGEPEGVSAVRDKDGDGNVNNNTPGEEEWAFVYDETQGDIELATPKGAAFLKGPTIEIEGDAKIGKPVFFNMDGVPNQVYKFLIGTDNASFVAPPHGTLFVFPKFLLPWGVLDGEGKAQLKIGIVNDPGLVGLKFRAQIASGDAYLVLLSNFAEGEIEM